MMLWDVVYHLLIAACSNHVSVSHCFLDITTCLAYMTSDFEKKSFYWAMTVKIIATNDFLDICKLILADLGYIFRGMWF